MISGIVAYFIIALIEFVLVWTSAKRNLDEITAEDLIVAVVGSLTIVVIPLIALHCYIEKLSDKLGKTVIWRKK